MSDIVIFHPAGIGDCILDISNLYQLITSERAPNKLKYVCNASARPLIECSGLEQYLEIYYLKYPIISIHDIFSLYELRKKNQKIFVLGGMHLRKVGYFRHLWPNQVEFYGVLENFPEECINKIRPNGGAYNHIEGPSRNSHRIVENFNLFKSQGFVENSDFLISGLDRKIISKMINLSNIKTIEKPYIVLHAGKLDNNSKKTMELDNWKTLLASLINSIDEIIVIIGTNSERMYIEEIISSLNKKKIINLCGKTSLIEVIGLIEKAEIVLAVDSAIAHITASIGKNLFAIFGPTDPTIISPVGTNGYIIKQQMECSPCYWTKNYFNCPYHRCCLNEFENKILSNYIIKFLKSGIIKVNNTYGYNVTSIPTIETLQKQLF